MQYLALACDYDGTLASGGQVAKETLAALERLRSSGRKLVLVTGRKLDDLLVVFPHTGMFERVVAENGALLYRPANREIKVLADPPPEEFIGALRKKRIEPLSIGRVIVATSRPHETTMLEVIRDLGLELQVIFNKGAVMILPSGVNKATGLFTALRELDLSFHNTVGVGDAENDHAFLRLCEFSVAVANALPVIKAHADLCTAKGNGSGVVELIDRLLASDLHEWTQRCARHDVLLGTRKDGHEVRIKPHGVNLLLAGSSGGGKSTIAKGLLERLADHGYQFCVIDPEGDYQALEGALTLGNAQQAPSIAEIMQLLENIEANVVVNLLGIPFQERPAFFEAFLPRLHELKTRTGRPHWLVVDEAHHLLPRLRESARLALARKPDGTMFVTVNPHELASPVLGTVSAIIAVGDAPKKTMADFCKALGVRIPSSGLPPLSSGEAYMWEKGSGKEPFFIRAAPSYAEHRRHRRKYAEGELSQDRSFYFHGPEGKLRLRAQNLILFMQMADGVDDDTWEYHLRRGDYSRWFREAIKDTVLADVTARIEKLSDLSPSQSRALIREVIEEYYTLPSTTTAL